MVCHHVGRILNGIAGLFVRASLLQDVGRQNIADIVWTMRQKTRDCAAAGVRVEDAVSLDGQAPGL